MRWIPVAVVAYFAVCVCIGKWLKHAAFEPPADSRVTVVWRNADVPIVCHAASGTVTAVDEWRIMISDEDSEPVIVDTRQIKSVF